MRAQVPRNQLVEGERPRFCIHTRCIADDGVSEVPCLYSEERLNDPNSRVTGKMVMEELVRHKHPSSRTTKKNGRERGRNVAEAKAELIAHYRYEHQR